ncbi:MAG TPA: hypothetical protein VK860_04660 [Ilumatobacteraceae bacterium]|nr:hypothetical protein [Ilumatobacteraceae bacterium]
MSANIEEQIRAVADAAFDQTSPVDRDRYVAETNPAKHRWWLVAAASVLLFALVGALALIDRSDDEAPAIQSDGGAVIDPSGLRFSEPLAEDTVAFFDAPTIPAPRIAPEQTVPASPGDLDALANQPDSVRVLVMDEATLLMTGVIVDVRDGADPTGPTVDVGVDDARYVDADEGAIAIPLGDGFRIVAPREYFMFGGGGPFIEPAVLVDIAAAVGDRPIEEIDDLDGFYVDFSTIDGERSGLLGVDQVTVTHSPSEESSDGVTTSIVRLPQTPTQQELLSIAHSITRGEIDPPALGDVTFTAGTRTYLELVSPIDLLIVNAPTTLGDILDSLQFGPLAELE